MKYITQSRPSTPLVALMRLSIDGSSALDGAGFPVARASSRGRRSLVFVIQTPLAPEATVRRGGWARIQSVGGTAKREPWGSRFGLSIEEVQMLVAGAGPNAASLTDILSCGAASERPLQPAVRCVERSARWGFARRLSCVWPTPSLAEAAHAPLRHSGAAKAEPGMTGSMLKPQDEEEAWISTTSPLRILLRPWPAAAARFRSRCPSALPRGPTQLPTHLRCQSIRQPSTAAVTPRSR